MNRRPALALSRLLVRISVAAALVCIARPAHAQNGGKGANFSALDPKAPPDTSAITPEMIAAGRKIYFGKGGCIVCHGSSMEGTPVAPPHKKTEGWKDAKDGAFPELTRVISTGVAGTLMVAFPNGIKPNEVVLAASFIWAVNHRGEHP